MSGADEIVTKLASGTAFHFEHIASHGAASPSRFWYDQDDPEWVALIRGSATIEFPDGSLHLHAGDSLEIPAHLKHRVSSTSHDAIWLALHFQPEGGSGERKSRPVAGDQDEDAPRS